MLKVLGRHKQLCDGITRRDLMQIGGLSLFGSMNVPKLLRAAGASGGRGPPSRCCCSICWVVPRRWTCST
ncbi:MAG: hypothetical protein Ct9H300mP1_18300 [Planctomycetaceae bacterium]|nr:MAG: hypothetical protein Ct9H300mP1_18300 [Planctomycetaceae bacterium]